MKIALDARWIFKEISGIGAYTRELLRQFNRIDQENEYLVLFQHAELRDRTLAECGIQNSPYMKPCLLPYGLFTPRNQVALPRFLKQHDIDLYHTTNYMMPLLAFPRNRPHRPACVTTIHDVIPMIFPNAAPESKKARVFPIFKRLMHEIGTRADTIITDSAASAKDIGHHLRIPEAAQDKIKVIPCAVSERFVPPATRTVDRQDTRTVLYVGRSDPYKNIDLLVRAFAKARARAPMQLIVAGSPDPRYPTPLETAKSLGIGSAVRWTGYISDNELLELYQTADVLVHPSRYEGFGLQVLEAMACGLPVVCSNGGSLPEVAGDAAIVLDVNDEDGFANAMHRVVSDETLAEDMRTKGLAQATRFTWEHTARRTLEVYQQTAEAHA